MATCKAGSPPQVRGKLSSVFALIDKYRITPAGAGKTKRYTLSSEIPQDHPRRCGENSFWFRINPTAQGSPPQVRGKPTFFIFLPPFFGITPAGAGKTDKMQYHNYIGQDHPRRCGENTVWLSSHAISTGSPPQVRGKLGGWEGLSLSTWITPAGAGKTVLTLFDAFLMQDHPRRCGENS